MLEIRQCCSKSVEIVANNVRVAESSESQVLSAGILKILSVLTCFIYILEGFSSFSVGIWHDFLYPYTFVEWIRFPH